MLSSLKFARLLAALLLTLAPTLAASSVPSLHDQVPTRILKARVAKRTCDIGERHRDPCATLRIRHNGDQDRVTIAWDATTRKVTFLYSTTLQTDDDLAVGGLGLIDTSSAIQPFLGGFVSPDWCDTDADLSGDNLWCAVMKPAPRHNGKVFAFVQSIYLPFSPGLDDLPLRLAHFSNRRCPSGTSSTKNQRSTQ